MRPIPILTATVTVVVLFFLVFQRDTVLRLAGLDRPAPAPEAAQTAAAASESAASGAAVQSTVSVVVLKSESREIDSAVVLRGHTEAARSVQLRAETAGKVVSAPRPKGSQVAAGDVLCRIDRGTREATLTEARARLAEAEANAPTTTARVAEAEARLAEARKSLDNAQTLFDQGFAAETRLIAARAAMESARAARAAAGAGAASATAAIDSARAAVARAERDIANTTITAPFAGVLESDSAETGALLAIGAPCATVIDLDPIRLVGFVAEADVDRVKIGAAAGARLASGRQLAGTVTFLSRSADANTRTFRVEAEVANPDLAIRDGQSARIALRTAGRKAHLLPQSALTLDDAGTLGVRLAVREAGAQVARFVPVEMLRDSREGVWVAGLPERAEVIVSGQDYVSDGVPLDVSYRESGS